MRVTLSLKIASMLFLASNVDAFASSPFSRRQIHRSTFNPHSPKNFNHALKFVAEETIMIKSPPTIKTITTNQPKIDFVAPSLYAIFTYMLICIINHFHNTIILQTLGSKSLALVTGALIWDNGVISVGSFFFRDIASNPTKYRLLKLLSHPRFTLHAIGVPMQCITIAEMGKAAGVGFLQSSLVQSGIAVVAFVTVSNCINESLILNVFGTTTDENLIYRRS